MNTIDLSGHEPGSKEDAVSKSENIPPVATENRNRRKQMVLLVLTLCFAQYTSFSSIFILSSFFPKVGQNKGANGMLIGSIIGMPECIFIAVLITEIYLMNKIMLKTQVIFGLIITGVAAMMFGALDKITKKECFISIGLLLRAIQGVGIGMVDLCVFLLANKTISPVYLATVIGTLECILATSIALSPPLGGILYQVEGFYFPFLISGIMCFIGALLCFYQLPLARQEEQFSLKTVLKYSVKFDMFVSNYHFAVGGIYFGFFGGMIEPHLRKFNLSPFYVGLMILVENSCQAIFFPIWGYICDKQIRPSVVTLIGYVLTTIGLILFGPFPFLPLEISVGICVLSLILCGIGVGGFMISAYSQANIYLRKACPNQEIADVVISTSYISVENIGSYLGTLLGGIFVDYIGYSYGCVIWILLNVIGILLQIVKMCRNKSRKDNNI